MENYFFLKTASLQRELFLTMFDAINSSPLLVTKWGFILTIILSNIVSTAFKLDFEDLLWVKCMGLIGEIIPKLWCKWNKASITLWRTGFRNWLHIRPPISRLCFVSFGKKARYKYVYYYYYYFSYVLTVHHNNFEMFLLNYFSNQLLSTSLCRPE